MKAILNLVGGVFSWLMLVVVIMVFYSWVDKNIAGTILEPLSVVLMIPFFFIGDFLIHRYKQLRYETTNNNDTGTTS